MATDTAPAGRHVVLVGVNHTCSSVELRDRLIFPPDRLYQGLEAFKRVPGVLESLILSTCNRVELYAVTENPEQTHGALLDFLSSFHDIPRSTFESSVYYYRCDDALEHLFDVSASLDSLVVGEYQILGQLKEAHKTARESGNTGAVLNTLFQLAVTAGKRARAETKIGEGAVSISSAAVKLARQILGRLDGRTALIIGAGEMSELTVKHLKQAGIGRLIFTNRTLERSMALAKEYSGRAVEFGELVSILHEADVVISATASPLPILGFADVERAMARRKNDSMFLIDIAAPRDIETRVGELYNVFLYTIDDLIRVTQDSTQTREKEIENVRIILKEEMDHYRTWFESLKIRPLLVALRKRFETLTTHELRRYSSEINSLNPEAQLFVRQFAESLTNRFLREPSKVLIEMANSHDTDALVETITRVFGLHHTHEDTP